MGNCCTVEGAVDHWIYVKTGDRKDAGTDANIKVILYDNLGKKTPEITLDCMWKNDFERGQTDTFQCPPLPQLGDVVQIELWRDNAGLKPDWFCEVIVINDAVKDRNYYFPVQRWVKADKHYMIRAFDTSLPQDDPYKQQRNLELQDKRELYEYDQKGPGLPLQILNLPDDEQFSDDYKWDLEGQKRELIMKAMLTRLTTGCWEDIADLTNVYKYSDVFPEPKCMPVWSTDGWFGAQRLIGCNPTQIKLCTELPENMGVTAEMLRPFLEGWTVKQIVDARRLFIVDHKILEGLPTTDGRRMIAPLALFFLNGDKQLIPIAIQLHQDIAPDNPVFLCNDSPFTWMLAKMWFNLADASVHQSLTHLGFTHLIMEGIVIATHRNIAPNHPIFRLLMPHFLFLLAINWRGLATLVSPGGWVDKTMLIGTKGMFELIRRGVNQWKLNVQGNLPRELETRGVLDPKVLPNYHYRDDSLMIHKAIENYVKKIVKGYYTDLNKLESDEEIQHWAQEMATPKSKGGVGLRGVPHDGKLKSTDDLVMMLTGIIFTCSVQHAASNFAQYDEYGFPPNYPAYLSGDPPADKLPRTEEDIIAALPDKALTVDTMVVTKLLSMHGTRRLTDWEFQYQYEHTAIKAEKELQEELEVISRAIKSRNAVQVRPGAVNHYYYPYLDPENIPNSISI